MGIIKEGATLRISGNKVVIALPGEGAVLTEGRGRREKRFRADQAVASVYPGFPLGTVEFTGPRLTNDGSEYGTGERITVYSTRAPELYEQHRALIWAEVAAACREMAGDHLAKAEQADALATNTD